MATGIDPDARLSSAVIGRHHGFGDFALGAGVTALMRSAKHNDLESIRLLLEAGADTNLELDNGTTALSLVSETGRAPANEEAQALLQKFISKRGP